MDWRESVFEDERSRSTRYVRGRLEVAMGGRVVQLYPDLAPDPSLCAEDTKPKAETDGLPLTLDSHRTGGAVS